MSKKVIVSIISIIIGISIIVVSLNLKNNMNSIYNYTVQKNHDYSILLKPNTFYETEFLPSGGYYVTNSINDYIIDLNYEFVGNKKVNMEYNYNIIATLIGTIKDNDNEDKQVWERKFILKKDTKNKQESTDKIDINEKTTIDFDYYKGLVDDYEKTYRVSINAFLKVRCNVINSIISEDIDVNSGKVEDYIELEIPINNTISEVKQDYENTTTRSINTKTENYDLLKNILYVLGTIFIIESIILIVLELKKSKKILDRKYKYNINHMLKYYKDLIVTVDNKPDIEGLKVIQLSTLEDLIDVAEQTKNNIILFEKPYLSRFYVIVNNYVYVYKLIKKIIQ